ncbi:aquaporin family protein [Leptospira wolffii]|uniref:MIP family channel protein n=1 Tax=Leptospira wolffii TaxID=409998 RepID=A0A2M9Z913_9LEPT|nr:MIP/aquaporin family protein [Leptospira wolffii]PJZ64895.1 MIP family channel protein [Leptospira wolffii]TGK58191.1 aquaporin family protein [Leptospira wolffii]TGK67409.1 aquaporin family protein [Leptospira wolffii]TGK68869.1 aquaporin family protein [Leptospira wolffii]TGL27221.1 aquaporin family protein [Leptospira wolffii]
MISPAFGEFLGTFTLILLGDGVVAGVLLERSKAKDSGWMVITSAWAFAVMLGIFVAKAFGSADAHLNPAVTLAFAIQSGDYSKLLIYIPAQLFGAFLGAVAVYLHYLPHWKETGDRGKILSVFSTEPAIKHGTSNFISEFLGTFLLILGVYSIFSPQISGLSVPFGIFFVGILVWAIGLSMGGTTGYAINPARDLGPRLAHFILPIPNKGPSGWEYAWLPVVAPLAGAIAAGFLLKVFFS